MRRLGRGVAVFPLVVMIPASTSATHMISEDTIVIVSDAPKAPDLIIQDVRAANANATHTPVRVRLSVPIHESRPGEEPSSKRLEWARVTALLARGEERLTEATVRVGPQWANRSIILKIPSPGSGEYSVQVRGELWFDDGTSVELTSTTSQSVRFGSPETCVDIEPVPLDHGPCPLVFLEKSSELAPPGSPSVRDNNARVMATAIEKIDALCRSGALRRVSVRGWASTTNSLDPTNEELAHLRAETVLRTLSKELSGCSESIRNASVPGVRSVTEQFGPPSSANQCVQIQIERHTCRR